MSVLQRAVGPACGMFYAFLRLERWPVYEY